MANSALEIFAAQVSPQQQFEAAQQLQASIMGQVSASRLAEESALQEAQKQKQIVETEKLQRENDARKKAEAVAQQFGPDQLIGALSFDFQHNTQTAIQARQEYADLNAVSFLDNPLMYVVNSFKKDQVAGTVNNAEAAADQAAQSMRQISAIRTEAGQAADATAKIMSDGAMEAATKARIAEDNKALYELQSKNLSADIVGISHLQSGAYQKVQMQHSAAVLGMEQQKHAQWMSEAPLRAMEAKARYMNAQTNIAEIPLREKEIEYKKQKLAIETELLPLEKQQKELAIRNLKTDTEVGEATAKYKINQAKQEDTIKGILIGEHQDKAAADKAELDMVNDGLRVLGLPPQETSKLTAVYNKDQLQRLKIIGGSSAIDGKPNFGNTVGEAYVNLKEFRVPTKDKSYSPTMHYLDSVWEKALNPNVNTSMTLAKTAQDKQTAAMNFMTQQVAKDQKVWGANAEHKDSIYKAPSISTILATDHSLGKSKAAQVIFAPLTATTDTNTATDFDAISGRILAALKTGEISESDAAKVGSQFYQSIQGSNQAYKLLDSFGMAPQQGYVVRVGDAGYDLTNPAEFRRAMLAKIKQSTLENWDMSLSRPSIDPIEFVHKLLYNANGAK